jgi:hypothetical protein
MTSPVRRQHIPGQAAIWTWEGSTPWIRHEVRVELAPVCQPGTGRVLAAAGSVFYTIWAGDLPSPAGRVLDAAGAAGAARHVARLRRHQADRLAANRWLVLAGYDPTEHAGRRPDCNCAMCGPPRACHAPRRRYGRAG